MCKIQLNKTTKQGSEKKNSSQYNRNKQNKKKKQWTNKKENHRHAMLARVTFSTV